MHSGCEKASSIKSYLQFRQRINKEMFGFPTKLQKNTHTDTEKCYNLGLPVLH